MLEINVSINEIGEDDSGLDLTIEVKPTTIQPMDQKPDKEIVVHYEHDPNYRVIAANSAMTTISEFNDIRIDFFVQGIGMPEATRVKIEADGSVQEISQTEKVVRRAQVGILLSIDQAVAICKFVLEEAEKAQARRKK